MQDREVIIDAMEEAQRILAEHLEPGSIQQPSRTIHRLVLELDRPDVTAALQRMKGGRGLRVLS